MAGAIVFDIGLLGLLGVALTGAFTGMGGAEGLTALLLGGK